VAGATTTLIVTLFDPQAAAIPAASKAAANFQTLIPTPPHDLNTSATLRPMIGALPIRFENPEP
jgi:hypothetical protein